MYCFNGSVAKLGVWVKVTWMTLEGRIGDLPCAGNNLASSSSTVEFRKKQQALRICRRRKSPVVFPPSVDMEWLNGSLCTLSFLLQYTKQERSFQSGGATKKKAGPVPSFD